MQQQTKRASERNQLQRAEQNFNVDRHIENSSSLSQESQSQTMNLSKNLIPTRQKWAIYIISIGSVLDSIKNKTIVQTISHRDQITTTIYKCKLEFLSAYNYTYAVYLTNILNKSFVWAKVQILPLPSIDKQIHKPNQIDQFQIVYRFDLYDPDYIERNKNVGTANESAENQQINPMPNLLKKHFQYLSIDLLLESYLKNNSSISNLLTKIKALNSQSHTQSKIKQNEGKIQFLLDLNDVKDQKLIHIFETNLIFNMFLKPYHLYHNFKQCGDKFKDIMMKTFIKYPYAAMNNQSICKANNQAEEKNQK